MNAASAVLVAVLAASCSRQIGSIDRSKLVDLSYSYNAQTVYWPNAAEGFQHQKDNWKITPQGYWYAAGQFSSAEHGGTHLDAPIHFGQGKTTVDRIPVANLVGPAGVVDVTSAAARDRDYRVGAQDLTDWEQAHG